MNEKLMQLQTVRRTELSNGKGWKFTGVFNNGTEIILRAKATTAYNVAAIHSTPQVSKFYDKPQGEWIVDATGEPWASDGIRRKFVFNTQTDPRAYVTFHNALPRAGRGTDVILKTIEIVS